MSAPVLPIVIRESGVLLFNSLAWYWTGNLTIKETRPTFTVDSDFWGKFDTRASGGPMVEIEFTPVGQVQTLDAVYPYGPSNLVAESAIGNSIFNGACLITTKSGKTFSYARAGISKTPTLNLSPKKTAFGSMTITAMNRIDVQPTTASVLKTIASGGGVDASFDPTKILTDIYTASLGARLTPYNAMGARTGFELEQVLEIEDAPDDNIGVADRLITGVMWKCRFAPNNLTQAQIDTLAMFQGADAILAGQSVARGPAGAPEDLIIDADFLTATIHKVGVVSKEHGYGVKIDQNGMIEFAQQMSFTDGVPDPLVTLTLN